MKWIHYVGQALTGNESGTEERIKTEFLNQIDKIRTIPGIVSVFATNNMPLELEISVWGDLKEKYFCLYQNLNHEQKS